jgi:hypothetical protein
MSAIKPGTEFAGFDGVMAKWPDDIASSHANLTRTLWIRKELEKQLLERSFEVVEGEAHQLMIQVTPKIPKAAIPWFVGTQDHGSYYLFGTNGKMHCPTHDLPSGPRACGGSCPGSTAGQTTVPEKQRKAAEKVYERVTGQRVNPVRTICSRCYATGGNYASPHVQAGEIARYWWARDCIEGGRAEEFISTMTDAIARLTRSPEARRQFESAEKAHGIHPVRVHSSGDFFSPAHLEAWVEIVNRAGEADPKLMFWAPSRIWVAGFDFEALQRLRRPNFIVRPSAFHFGDRAPDRVAGSTAVGTTSWLKKELSRAEADGMFDWNCGAYTPDANGVEPKSCEFAVDPEGKKHCRACWTHPEMRVNYTSH